MSADQEQKNKVALRAAWERIHPTLDGESDRDNIVEAIAGALVEINEIGGDPEVLYSAIYCALTYGDIDESSDHSEGGERIRGIMSAGIMIRAFADAVTTIELSEDGELGDARSAKWMVEYFFKGGAKIKPR